MGECILARRGGAGGGISNTPPKTWTFLQAFTSNGNFRVPKDGWYRVECFGQSKNGGNGGDGGLTSAGIAYGGDGGDGGSSGGYSCSYLRLKEGVRIPITVNTSISSFGDFLSATTINGVGGTEMNAPCTEGGKGGEGGTNFFDNSPMYGKPGLQGENNGAKGGRIVQGNSDNRKLCGGGSGGGGGRYSGGSEFISSNMSSFYAGTSGSGIGINPTSPTEYPSIMATGIPILYGGGSGGGGGAYSRGTGGGFTLGANGSKGTPACLIISKGAK